MPGKYPLSPEESEARNREYQEKIDAALKLLDEAALALGYNQVPTLEDLGLTPEEIKQFHFISQTERRPTERYYMADRKDGGKAKTVTYPVTENTYTAEFFSPSHHGGNNDFSLYEMKGNFKLHLELPPK